MKKPTNGKSEVIRGDRVRKIRIARGLTQRQVAQLAGMGLRQYGRLETEHPDCMFSTVIHLARVLGVTTDYLGGLSELPEGPLTINDLPPDLRDILQLYRGIKNDPDKILDLLGAIAANKGLRGETEK